jgi:hypothetical protein
VYQDPRRFTNETPEGRLRLAGVLTPSGELNLEATDYGRQARLAEDRKRTDAILERMIADDVARNPTNDPGLWDSSRRDPADPRGVGVPRSDPAALTQNMPSYEADRIVAQNKKLDDLDSQYRLGYPHPESSMAIQQGRAIATNAAGPIRGLDPGTPSDWPSIVPEEWPAPPRVDRTTPSLLAAPDARATPQLLDRPGTPYLLEQDNEPSPYVTRPSSPNAALNSSVEAALDDLAFERRPVLAGRESYGAKANDARALAEWEATHSPEFTDSPYGPVSAARAALRRTPQAQLMDLANIRNLVNFRPPLPYGLR